MKEFPCTMCGCCCRRVGEAIKAGLDFPYEVDDNGVCEMLGEGNVCKVYKDRPLICNIRALGEALGRDIGDFYEENVKACNEMMDKDGIDEKYRIHNNKKE